MPNGHKNRVLLGACDAICQMQKYPQFPEGIFV